jgi:cytochrome c peroxidase
MKGSHKYIVLGCCLLSGLALADDALYEQAKVLFGQINAPDDSALTDPAVALGRMLFWDERASGNGEISCTSCHKAEDGSSDRRPRSLDARGNLTARHSQPVFNLDGQLGFRWTADRADLAAQARGSLTGSMGFDTLDQAMTKLAELGYASKFMQAFPDAPVAMTPDHYGLAIAAYESTLTTPAPFDRFLAGDDRALSDQQKSGLRFFIQAGCASCHSGPLLGGTSLQRFGLFGNYWEFTESPDIDEGRAAATGDEADKFVFRVPMLRNIADTAPYFHDGSVPALSTAVGIMAELQLGSALPASQVDDIVEFLRSLSGETPLHYSAPALSGRP